MVFYILFIKNTTNRFGMQTTTAMVALVLTLSLVASSWLLIVFVPLGPHYLLITIMSALTITGNGIRLAYLLVYEYYHAWLHIASYWCTFGVFLDELVRCTFNAVLFGCCFRLWRAIALGSTQTDAEALRSAIITVAGSISYACLSCMQYAWAVYSGHPWHRIPLIYGNLAMLITIACACPLMTLHMLVKLLKQREQCMARLKQSSISKSLLCRLFFGLLSVIIVSLTSIAAIMQGSATGRLADVHHNMLLDIPVVHARMRGSAWSAIALAAVFGTGPEAWKAVKRMKLSRLWSANKTATKKDKAGEASNALSASHPS